MSDQPRLLSGGNPQIPKGYGDEPVQAWIDATPGWKQPIAQRLDELIAEVVPGVAKAVKWNSPFYGTVPGEWFVSLHGYAKYVKVAFFRGAALEPMPPGASKQAEVRYLDIREHGFDEDQFRDWIRQAAELPGLRM
ncbi:MAG: DUF1801 domain-containing protein [Caulobacteraceae bacterium]|nr:DUF1801 domain-containing protein [Caulobacteraceae bacterium]